MEMENKNQFLEIFKERYKDLKWLRKDQDLIAELTNFKLEFISSRDGIFLQVYRKGNSLGYGFSEKDYPQLKEYRAELWDFINRNKEDIYWGEVVEDFSRTLLHKKG